MLSGEDDLTAAQQLDAADLREKELNKRVDEEAKNSKFEIGEM